MISITQILAQIAVEILLFFCCQKNKRLERIAGNLPAGRQEDPKNLCSFANKKFLYA
jgi:hypothetical protein